MLDHNNNINALFVLYKNEGTLIENKQMARNKLICKINPLYSMKLKYFKYFN